MYVCYCLLLCCQLTVSQIKEFTADVRKFKEKFRLYGPGSVGADLDRGLEFLIYFSYNSFVLFLEAEAVLCSAELFCQVHVVCLLHCIMHI